MFWLSKFFTKGKSIDDAVKFFTKINGRPPSGIENIKIKLAFGEANRPTNVIEFPKDRITDWRKPRPAKTAEKTEEYPGQFLADKQSKELEELSPDKYPGVSWYHEMNQMLKRHNKETLQFEYDAFFEKLLGKAKTVDTDPKILLEAEFGKKLTGKETADQLLELFKNRPKKAQGGRMGYWKGEIATQRKKEKDLEREKWQKQRREMDMMPNWRQPFNFPYKSREDIPENVLAMLEKDPVFDLDTFLKKIAWSDADRTRLQDKLKEAAVGFNFSLAFCLIVSIKEVLPVPSISTTGL